VIRRYVGYDRLVGTMRRRTISALIYPAILVTLMVGLVGIIVLWVIPAFSGFYGEYDQALPLSTQVVIAISTTIVGYFWWLLFGGLAAVALTVTWARREPEQVDRLLLELPVVGETARKFATAQLARTLATLLGGGIPLVNALETSARSLSNRYLARELDMVRQRVQEGESFSAALRARGVVPEMAVKMVEVGESTGALQEMLNSVADFFDEDIETEVARFITLVEPILLVVMGLVIALVVLSLYMPLFELSALVGP
jgi:type IV pilus assembly protein PilC